MADTPSPIDAASFQAKAATNKSGLTPLGNITVSPTQTNELLANMQQMINQRATVDPDRLVFSGGPVHNTIMSSLKDAAAWASGGAKGPTEGLALRDAEKAREAKDLFEMRTKMAEYKAAQESAKATADRIAANLRGGAAGASGSGAGMTYNGIPVPMSVQAQIKDLPATQQDAYLNEWLKTMTTEGVKAGYNPAANEQKPYAFPGIGTVSLTSNQLAALDPAIRARIEKATLEQFGPDALAPTTTTAPTTKTTSETAPAVKGTPVSLDLVTKDPVLRRIGAGESSLTNVPNAGGDSNAHGLYQIVPKTFELVKAKYPEFKDVTWEQFKEKPEIQTSIAEKLHAENDKLLDQRKVDKTDLNRYTVWFSGDTKLATAAPDTPIEKVMTPLEVAKNKLAGKTVEDVRNKLQANLDRGDKVLAGLTSKTGTETAPVPERTPETAATKRVIEAGAPNPRDYTVPGAYEAARKNYDLAQQESNKSNILSLKEEHDKFLARTDQTKVEKRAGDNDYLKVLINKWSGNKNVAGILNDPGWGNAMATLLEQGINTPGGAISMPAITEALQKVAPGSTRDEIEASKEMQRVLGQRIFDVVQQSKGSSSDRDWQAFKQIAGSTANGWDALHKMQQYDEAAIKLDKEERSLYKKTYNGTSYDYGKLTNMPEREAALSQFGSKLSEINRSHYTPVNTPPRPSNVPQGAQYNPKLDKWRWKDSTGNWKTT